MEAQNRKIRETNNREIILAISQLRKQVFPDPNRNEKLQNLFRRLIEENTQTLIRFLQGYWPSYTSDYEDVLQDFWIEFLKNFDRFQLERDFTSWAIGLLSNLMKKRHRQAKTALKTQEHISLQLKQDFPQTENLGASDEDPKILYLRTRLRELSPDDYNLVFLRYFERKTIKEICLHLKKSKSTIMERLQKIRRRLR